MTYLRRNLEGFDRCPLCGVAEPLLQFQHSIPHYRDPSDEYWFAWLIYQCSKCGGPICAEAFGHRQYASSNQPTFSQLTPTGKFLPEKSGISDAVPANVRRFLAQAIASLHAPDGAAMLANSAVDAMLKERGLRDGSVYKRLGEAVKLGLITNEIREWADRVRVESNNPRHADDEVEPITTELAGLLVEFSKSLADILFVLPAKAAMQSREADELQVPEN